MVPLLRHRTSVLRSHPKDQHLHPTVGFEPRTQWSLDHLASALTTVPCRQLHITCNTGVPDSIPGPAKIFSSLPFQINKNGLFLVFTADRNRNFTFYMLFWALIFRSKQKMGARPGLSRKELLWSRLNMDWEYQPRWPRTPDYSNTVVQGLNSCLSPAKIFLSWYWRRDKYVSKNLPKKKYA